MGFLFKHLGNFRKVCDINNRLASFYFANIYKIEPCFAFELFLGLSQPLAKSSNIVPVIRLIPILNKFYFFLRKGYVSYMVYY